MSGTHQEPYGTTYICRKHHGDVGKHDGTRIELPVWPSISPGIGTLVFAVVRLFDLSGRVNCQEVGDVPKGLFPHQVFRAESKSRKLRFTGQSRTDRFGRGSLAAG